MNSVVSFVASADFQRINYDHWEDGYEADVFNPAPGTTFPTGTTLVLGDGNAANGDACTSPWGPTQATRSRGQALNLASNPPPAAPATGTQVRCRPVNPRDPVRRGTHRHDRGPSPSSQPGRERSSAARRVLPAGFANATAYSILAGGALPERPITEPFIRLRQPRGVPGRHGGLINSPTVGTRLPAVDHPDKGSTTLVPHGARRPRCCTGGATEDHRRRNAPGADRPGNARTERSGLTLHRGRRVRLDFFPILPDLLRRDYAVPSSGGGDERRPAAQPVHLQPRPLNALSQHHGQRGNGHRSTSPRVHRRLHHGHRTFPNSGSAGAISPPSASCGAAFWPTVHDHQSPNSDWGYAWLQPFLTDFYWRPCPAAGPQQPPPSCGTRLRHTELRLWVGATQTTRVSSTSTGTALRPWTRTATTPRRRPADPPAIPPPTSGLCLYVVALRPWSSLHRLRQYGHRGQARDRGLPRTPTGRGATHHRHRLHGLRRCSGSSDPVLTVRRQTRRRCPPPEAGHFTATVRSSRFGRSRTCRCGTLPAGSRAAPPRPEQRITANLADDPNLQRQQRAGPSGSTGRSLPTPRSEPDAHRSLRGDVPIVPHHPHQHPPRGPRHQRFPAERLRRGARTGDDKSVRRRLARSADPRLLARRDQRSRAETTVTSGRDPPARASLRAAAFTGTFSAAQNSVVGRRRRGPAPPRPSFQVTINAGTEPGTVLPNAPSTTARAPHASNVVARHGRGQPGAVRDRPGTGISTR
jgi:hypothetical protein